MSNYIMSVERPWVFAFFALAAFLILFPYFRMSRNKRRTAGRIVSVVFHFVAVIVVLFLLAGTSFTSVSYVPENTSMIVVIDKSDSTSSLHDSMEEYFENMIEQADDNTRLGVVVFSGQSIKACDLTNSSNDLLSAYYGVSDAGIIEDVTNISDALKMASEMFDTENMDFKRVVLLSDGRQTVGNAWEAAEVLLQKNIRLDAVSFDAVGTDNLAEVALLDFEVTPTQVIDQGKDVTLNVRFQSTIDTEGTIKFFDGDKQVWGYKIAINKGENRIAQRYTGADIKTVGLHELRVELEPEDDSIVQNNTLYTWVKVNGAAKILIVDGDGTQATQFVDQLKSLYETKVVSPYNFPSTMEELLPYDEIVLMNVDAMRLPEGSDVLIDRFVSVLGRGLLTTSGATEDSYMSYGDTKIADMLPIDMTLDEMDTNIAMVIVIDDSGSMISSTEKFIPAQNGAKAVIDMLAPTDYVGIVTFHATAAVRQQIVKVEDKEKIKEIIDGLSAVGNSGTSYTAGLNAAYDMLRATTEARSKHVIFLSDGEPTDSNYGAIPTNMKNQGITLSTIALCATSGAKDKMATMAENGGGDFYSIDNEADLSNLNTIMENLAAKAKEPQYVNQEPFTPLVGDGETGILAGVDSTKLVIGGYIGSTIKQDASLALYNDDYRAIIAEWEWGRGYVTSLMTDLSSDWCRTLFAGDSSSYGLRLISNLAAQSLNEEKQKSSMNVTATQVDRTANLRVETILKLFGQTVTATITSPDDSSSTITLTSAGTGIYRGVFETEEPNALYYLDITIKDAQGAIQDRSTFAYTGGVIMEYDLFNYDGDDLLYSITNNAGGAVYTDISDIYLVSAPDPIEQSLNVRMPCLIALIILMLFDITCRILNFSFRKKRRI